MVGGGDYFFLGMFRTLKWRYCTDIRNILGNIWKYMEISSCIGLKKQALYMIGTSNKSVPDMAMIAQKVKLTCFWVGQRSPDSQLLLAEAQIELLKLKF